MSTEAIAAPSTGDPGFARRLSLYIGHLALLRAGTFEVRKPYPGVVCHAGTEPQDVEAFFADPDAGQRFNRMATPPERAQRIARDYVAPLVGIHRELGIAAPFLVMPGDSRAALAVPGFAKARPLAQPGNTVLQPLRTGRHFAPVARVDAVDIPFAEKEPRLVWRGSSTDTLKRRQNRPHLGSRAHIPDVMGRVDPAKFDIGFSALVQTAAGTERPVEELERYVRDPISMTEQLRFRYILMLEGNDVASGLKWALYSNSVVLMPWPTVESWACESLLRPMKHYVPVQADLSDLEAQVAWCDANEDACRRIAATGREFMERFADPAVEAALAREVVREYHRRVTLAVVD